jgi:hypothetical protein
VNAAKTKSSDRQTGIATRSRALTGLFSKLEPELRDVDFKAQEFICQICSAYLRGLDVRTRQEYKDRRRWLKSIVRELNQIGGQCRSLREKLQFLPDEIRQAHKSRISPVSVLELAGLESPIQHYRNRSLADPAASLEELARVLTVVDDFFTAEIHSMRNKIPRTRALWKEHPILWWQKGGLEYLLKRLFTERCKLTSQRAYELIIGIRRKLDGSDLRIDKEKRDASGIRKRISDMPPDYKRACDRVLNAAFDLPTSH